MSDAGGKSAEKGDRFNEAAAWHARWRDSPGFIAPSNEEIERWTSWIESAANKRAYDAVVASWRLRYQLARPVLPSPEDLASDEQRGSRKKRAFIGRLPKLRILLNQPRWILSAAAALAICFVGLYVHSLTAVRAVAFREVATAEGEKEYMLLEDGSRVWLGGDTKVSIQFNRDSRTIYLHSGEALFDVAHNPSRPFVVLAGNGAITALGTQFSVRRTFDRVTVRVAEGAVKVQHRDVATVHSPEDVSVADVNWAEAKLAIGQEVTYAGKGKRSPVESADPHAAVAWLQGRREYRHEPLAYVVADINRYFGKHIVVPDPSIGQLQFTGRIYESQVDEWLAALATIFPIRVTQTGEHQLVIERRSGTADPQAPSAIH